MAALFFSSLSGKGLVEKLFFYMKIFENLKKNNGNLHKSQKRSIKERRKSMELQENPWNLTGKREGFAGGERRTSGEQGHEQSTAPLSFLIVFVCISFVFLWFFIDFLFSLVSEGFLGLPGGAAFRKIQGGQRSVFLRRAFALQRPIFPEPSPPWTVPPPLKNQPLQWECMAAKHATLPPLDFSGTQPPLKPKKTCRNQRSKEKQHKIKEKQRNYIQN